MISHMKVRMFFDDSLIEYNSVLPSIQNNCNATSREVADIGYANKDNSET